MIDPAVSNSERLQSLWDAGRPSGSADELCLYRNRGLWKPPAAFLRPFRARASACRCSETVMLFRTFPHRRMDGGMSFGYLAPWGGVIYSQWAACHLNPRQDSKSPEPCAKKNHFFVRIFLSIPVDQRQNLRFSPWTPEFLKKTVNVSYTAPPVEFVPVP